MASTEEIIDLTCDDDTPPFLVRQCLQPTLPAVKQPLLEIVTLDEECKESSVTNNLKRISDCSPEIEICTPPVKRARLQPVKIDENLKNHELFRKFIAGCIAYETIDHDKKRVEKKLTTYYSKACKEYTNSTKFADLLKSALETLSEDRLYISIRDVLAELKQNWTTEYVVASSSRTPLDTIVASDEESNQEDPKTIKHIKKLTKALSAVDRKIRKLEEEEVDLDDDYDSSYLKVTRYRERFVKIYKKLCELTDSPVHAERPIKKKISFNGTKFPRVNLAIQRWINKKKIFPDYSDVRQLIKTHGVDLPPAMVDTIAQQAFQGIGEKLQKLRKVDFWESIESFGADKDPAEDDLKLAAALAENRQSFKTKEKEVMDYFVKRQIESKDKKELEEDNEDEKSEDEEKDDSDVSSNCSLDLNDLDKEDNAREESEDAKE